MPEIVTPELPVITEQQYALWKHNPVTVVVREFLRAYKRRIEQEHLERWAAGNDDPKLEARALGVCIFAEEFLGLEFASLAKAYGEPDAGSEPDDGSKA
jgi:hypothetical protein